MLNKRMGDLSEEAKALEKQLAELCAEYAEIYYAMAPFLARLQKDLIPYQTKLRQIQREIADLRGMRGDRSALTSDTVDSALSRLLDDSDLSVEEQYKRYGLGQLPPRMVDEPNLPKAGPQLRSTYQQVIAAVHPMLHEGTDRYRQYHKLFKVANHAYAKRDSRVLRMLASSHAEKPSSLPAIVNEEAVEKMQDRVFRLEAAVAGMEGELFDFRNGDVARLRGYQKEAKKKGKDFIKELRQELKSELQAAVKERERLRNQL